MGYYSNLAIEGTYHEDHSYPSPELQLKWRIEDLRSRLEDISTGNYGITAHSFMGCRFSRDNLVAYTPPEYFSRESDVMDALAIAEESLAVMEAELREIEKSKTNTDELPGQLTIWDSLCRDRATCSVYRRTEDSGIKRQRWRKRTLSRI